MDSLEHDRVHKIEEEDYPNPATPSEAIYPSDILLLWLEEQDTADSTEPFVKLDLLVC